MRWFIKLLGRDWSRAPISGTAIIVCWIGALFAAYHGDTVKLLLWGIFAQCIANSRGPMPKENKS